MLDAKNELTVLHCFYQM